MAVCTFFGHRDCPETVKSKLREVQANLIENRSVDTFCVGNKGAFDRIVRSVLREMAQEYPGIRYAVVLERMPGGQNRNDPEDYSYTMLSEGIESVPPRYAISKRNEWLAANADTVIAYVIYSRGGAAKTLRYAQRMHKRIINLAVKNILQQKQCERSVSC